VTRLLVLDFDGTLTDAEEEGRPFREGYLVDLSMLCGRSLDETRALADGFEEEVKRHVGSYGWVFGGEIVAPAAVDPYLRIMPVARKVFDACGVFMNHDDRDRLLDNILYKYNYGKSAIAFKEGAREFLTSREGTETYVITNSHTEPVRNKVRALAVEGGDASELDWLVERVYGSAKKYVVDPSWDRLPESMSLPDLSRPVLLRRRLYFEALDRLRANAGLGWEDVVVVGDIFELDLCVPLALGARVGLFANEFTPSYEVEFLANHPRGVIIESMAQIADFVDAG
jgi:hypothetical protein